MMVAALALTVSATANAQSFFDGTFASGWSTQVIIGGGTGSGLTSPTAGVGGGGDPYWEVTHSVNCCGSYLGLFSSSPFIWNPSTQGAISNLTMSYQFRTFNAAVATGYMLQQGGRNYFRYAAAPNGGWSIPYVESGLEMPGMWCELTSGPTWTGCPGANPDFSSTGGQIRFGVFTANSSLGGGYGTTSGIDNFSVEFRADTPPNVTPEPASLALLATGLVGVGAVVRRRRRSR